MGRGILFSYSPAPSIRLTAPSIRLTVPSIRRILGSAVNRGLWRSLLLDVNATLNESPTTGRVTGIR